MVDQAEELFSLCHDQAERERFVQLLADHAEVAPLVLALRADRMGDVFISKTARSQSALALRTLWE